MLTTDNYYLSQTLRIALAVWSGLWGILQPTVPYVAICTGFIFLDCWSAWKLSKRVRAAHPDKTTQDTGKLRSKKLGKVIKTLIETYTVILLMYYADILVAPELDLHLAKVASAAVCGWQFWSYLENKASCNGARWANLARKIFVDKTSRHFEIDLSELKKELDESE